MLIFSSPAIQWSIFGGMLFFFFLVFYLIFSKREGELSLGAITVDNIRHGLLQQVTKEGQREKYDILKVDPGKTLRDSFLMGTLSGILLWLIGYLFGMGRFSILFVPLGMSLSVVITHMTVNSKFRKWQEMLEGGVPILVDFMPSFLAIRGVTTRGALEGTIPFLPEPLRSEMANVVDAIRRTGKAEKALMGLASRAQVSIVTAVCYRLSIAWDSTISPDLFQDLREEIVSANELTINRATSAKRGLFALVAVLGLLGGAVLGGYPALIWLGKMLSETFGA